MGGGPLAQSNTSIHAARTRSREQPERQLPVAESPAVAFDLLPKPISAREFELFQALIYEVSGIWLSHAKTALLVGRLSKRLRQLGIPSFTDYYQVVTTAAEEQTRMLDAIATNETRFFREPAQFEFLKQRIAPEWQADAARGVRSRKIRVWSAGCSTGQEPYSLAMALCRQFPAAAGWEIEIFASDLSTRALAVARAATWDAAKAGEIPELYLRAFMLRGRGEQKGKIQAGPEIRSVVRFLPLNLNERSYPLPSQFDLILCRNVLIYFDRESRQKVVRRLLKHLSARGYLFVGHAESLHTMNDILRGVITTVYAPIPPKKLQAHGPR
jgi:chemotaxis protein methyltransferase CheR